uniref:Reverse transcriptase/retrotransposon-derived protein RNase H-like domain-containing protein n=1 Tax=Phytophthora ramorum TaxID=164328 RepID=H3H499_PHYRM
MTTDTSDGADTTYTSEEDSIPVLGDDPETRLDSAFVAMMHEITTGDGSGSENTDTNTSEHLANEIELTDYAHELAFLPDLTEASETVLDYSGPNVLNPSATARQQESLVAVLKRHEKIMIASGNALPPPAYGVRARRTPLRHLRKLYELLKGLLKARLVVFSDSPWASPIVIVLKKNGVDIRLCIDYKLVNAVTAIMEYAMPLVDDLLTDLEAYLCGFWAIMMTMRARKVSAFVCALGHFEWLRMPFGLKNAPMIDNALWGFVQPKGGWLHFSELMRTAEAHAEVARTGVTDPSSRRLEESTTRLTKFEADRESSVTLDAVNGLVNSPVADMFSTGEPDESSLVPVFDRRSFVDDICFGSETFDACLETLDRLLQRFTECRISVSFTKSIFVQPKVDFLSHEVSAEGIRADTKKMKAVTELPFPASKKGMQSFLGALNYYSRFIQDFAVYGAALYPLKDEDFTPSGSLSAAKRSFVALQQKVAEAPILRHFDRDKEAHVTLFANEWALSSTLMQYHDDKLHPVRFCGRVLKDAEMNYHPAEKEVLALLLVLKVCYSQLVGRTIHVYTRFSTLEWVHKSKTLFGRATHFAVMLSPWHLVVNRVKERDYHHGKPR